MPRSQAEPAPGVQAPLLSRHFLLVSAIDDEKGLQALKRLAADRRALDPERHRLLIEELAEIPASNPTG